MLGERSEWRYTLGASIRVIDVDAATPVGEIVNVSVHGLMIAAAEPLAIDRRYRLRLVPPEELGTPIELDAEAAWSVRSLDPPCIQIGFRDMRLTESERVRLDRLVEASYRPELE